MQHFYNMGTQSQGLSPQYGQPGCLSNSSSGGIRLVYRQAALGKAYPIKITQCQ